MWASADFLAESPWNRLTPRKPLWSTAYLVDIINRQSEEGGRSATVGGVGDSGLYRPIGRWLAGDGLRGVVCDLALVRGDLARARFRQRAYLGGCHHGRLGHLPLEVRQRRLGQDGLANDPRRAGCFRGRLGGERHLGGGGEALRGPVPFPPGRVHPGTIRVPEGPPPRCQQANLPQVPLPTWTRSRVPRRGGRRRLGGHKYVHVDVHWEDGAP